MTAGQGSTGTVGNHRWMKPEPRVTPADSVVAPRSVVPPHELSHRSPTEESGTECTPVARTYVVTSHRAGFGKIVGPLHAGFVCSVLWVLAATHREGTGVVTGVVVSVVGSIGCGAINVPDGEILTPLCLVGVGAASGAASYWVAKYGTDRWSDTGFINATVVGGAGGAMGGSLGFLFKAFSMEATSVVEARSMNAIWGATGGAFTVIGNEGSGHPQPQAYGSDVVTILAGALGGALSAVR